MLQSNIITPRLRYNIEIHHMVYVNYCASTINSHIDLLDIMNSVHIASARHYSGNEFYYAHHDNSENYMQRQYVK